MIKDIGLYCCTPDQIVGCRKVSLNLLRGLEELGVTVHLNKSRESTGCIQGILQLRQHKLPTNTLVGPEIMVLPNEMPQLWKRHQYWVQPAQWVCDYMDEFKEIHDNKIKLNVWPVGVDVDMFSDRDRGHFKYDCFVYYKDVTKQVTHKDLVTILTGLKERGLTSLVLTYGKYKEKQFIEYCKRCRFGIFITGTESQGIAYMEALACGIPLFIWEIDCFLYGSYKFYGKNVSAAPYFDERCGMKANRYDWNKFDLFLSKLAEYSPRDYILENHTPCMGAKKYMDILERII